MKLNIEPDFENLLPPLTTEEYEQLKQNLTADAEAFPKIHVWANHKNTILDGHNQYRARNELRLPVKVVKHKFDSRDEALAFAIKCQLGRRNLTESQRAMVVAKLGKLPRGKPSAKSANLPIYGYGGENPANLPTSSVKAALSNTSVKTVAAADKVTEHGSAAIVKAVNEGVVKVSDAAAIVDLPKPKQNEFLKKVDAGEAKTLKDAAGINKRKTKPKEVSSAKLVDGLVRSHISPLVKGIDAVADANKGKRSNHKIANCAINILSSALRGLREGDGKILAADAQKIRNNLDRIRDHLES